MFRLFITNFTDWIANQMYFEEKYFSIFIFFSTFMFVEISDIFLHGWEKCVTLKNWEKCVTFKNIECEKGLKMG